MNASASPAAAVRVGLLGGFRIESDRAEHVLPLNAQRLVAHVCLAARSSRSLVAGLLWPDVTERHAQGSLRSTLWRLERSCPGLIHSAQGSIFLAPDVDVDVRDLVAWARRTLAPGDHLDADRAPEAAFTGVLLPGWYDDWVLLEREYLIQLRLHALERLAVALARVGRYGEALEAAHGALRCEPLRESAQRVVIRIYLSEGNVAEALRSYQRFADNLRTELDVAPSERLAQLVAPLQAGRRARSRR